MAFDSEASSQSFVLDEISDIAKGQIAKSFSSQTLKELIALKDLGFERFALTPLLKNHLLQLASDRGESKMRIRIDLIYNQIFLWMQQINSLEKGYVRASAVQRIIDQSMTNSSESKATSCRKSCAYCCHTPVSITTSEVEHLDAYLTSKAEAELSLKNRRSNRACPFLGIENECQVYEARPIACRKVLAVSPAELCNAEESNSPSYLLLIETEIIAAAFYNVESKLMILSQVYSA